MSKLSEMPLEALQYWKDQCGDDFTSVEYNIVGALIAINIGMEATQDLLHGLCTALEKEDEYGIASIINAANNKMNASIEGDKVSNEAS